MSHLPQIQTVLLMLSTAVTVGLLVRLARAARNAPFAPLIISTSNRYGSLLSLIGAIAIWQFTQGLEFYFPEHALVLHRLGYIGVAIVPPAAFRLAQRIAGREFPSLPVLAAVPALTLALNFSGSFSPLFWDATLSEGPNPFLEVQYGPWFSVHTGYSYICLAGAFALFWSHYKHYALRRREGVTISGALILPVLANVVELSIEDAGHLAITPLALGLTAIILYWTTQRDSTRDLLPQARREIVDVMGDPVFVIEKDRRLIFANRSGYELLGLKPGTTAELSAFPSLLEFFERNASEGDVSFEVDQAPHHFNAVRSSLDEAEGISVLVLRDVTQDRAAQERIQQLAYFDSLTGLPNRRLFRRRLDAAVSSAARTGNQIAVLVVDLDRFKQINDSLGHAAGDALLRAVGETFLHSLRPHDHVAVGAQSSVSRIGGDEFVILLTGIENGDAAISIAERLGESFEKPIPIEGQEVFTSISTGVAVYPEHGDTAQALLRSADQAMYEAKKTPGSAACVAISGPEAHSQSESAGFSLESSLRRALENGEFELFYQPLQSARSSALTGAEALLRWRHPEGRVVGPAEFIQRAEDTGLIVPLGAWVIRQAVEQLEKWLELNPNLGMKVNVSPVQLRDPALRQELASIAHRLPDPRALEIELTERVLMHDLERCEVVLGEISEMGFRLALDDFGTGYSSLSYLHRLPFDTVKIDRSFVTGLPDCTRSNRICRAIIDMAHGLGLDVTAEGIETAAQRDTLRDLGCDTLQGFWIGHPAEAGEMNERVHRDLARQQILTSPITDSEVE